MTEIVLGKYLGIVLFLLLMVALICLMPLSLLMGTDLDLGKLAAGALGVALLLAAFAAAGLYLSAVSSQPMIAAIATFGLLIMLWIIDSAAGNNLDGNSPSQLFVYLSLVRHNIPMLRGIVNSSDVMYYLLFIILFITFSIRQLDAQRLQK